jgi:ribosome-associated protein
MPGPQDIREFAIEAAALLADRHCEDVQLIDVRGLSQVCDYVLIGSGTSDRQMKSVAAELEELGQERSHRAFRSSRDEGGTWIVIDFVDMVTHLFEPNIRAYYDLESLWSDAKVIDWQHAGRPGGNGAAAVRDSAAGSSARPRPAGARGPAAGRKPGDLGKDE